MRTVATIALPLLASTSVYAQSSYVSGLTTALQGAGLTTLATALTAVPQSILDKLQSGNHTVFAPSNAALASIPAGTLTNTSELTSIITYHIAAGVINTADTNPGNHTIVRTALQGAPGVVLPGNQSQVLIVSETEKGNITVLDGTKGVITSTSTLSYQNLKFELIPVVLTVPGNITTVLTTNNQTTALAAAVKSVDVNLVNNLEKIAGLTIFAPNSAAFAGAAQVLGTANVTTIATVLSNHIINGTALYSSLISNTTTAVSAGGQNLTFATNSSGTFVTSGSSTAKIVQSDIITANGVVHLIDRLLLNTESNPSAAESAAASASSVQASQTSIATGPVSAAPTSSSSTTGSGSGAVELRAAGTWVMGLVVVGMGAMLV